MTELVLFFIGIVVGAIAFSPYLLYRRRHWMERARAVENDVHKKERLLDEHRKALDIEAKQQENEFSERRAFVENEIKQLQLASRAASSRSDELEKFAHHLEEQKQKFDSRLVAYTDLQQENQLLKKDLQNVDVNLNKLELDRQIYTKKQIELAAKSNALGRRYLADTVKAVISNVGSNNFTACKQRLLNVIEWCREIGFDVSLQEESRLLLELKAEFERAVKAAFEREEQARIKAQIREEQKLQKEIDAELKRLDRERAVIQAALDRALAAANNQHSEEVQQLQARLAEAEEKSRRAVSLAQQTKAGHVYIISNIGSFGEGVFKIGMTRRLDPSERIYELGNASVPFSFDVHVMISCNDAPALENALHRELHKARLNKVKPSGPRLTLCNL
jgi:hypothetical protein